MANIKGVINQSPKEILLWGYVSSFVTLLAGIGLLPVLITRFNANELSLYFILQSILAIVSLFDLGYGPQLSKQVTYILSGAQTIESNGVSRCVKKEKINVQLFNSVTYTAIIFYKHMSLLATFASIAIGYVYIYNAESVNIDLVDDFNFLWFIFGINVYLHIRVAYINPMLNGAGLIIECRKVIIISKLVYFLFSLLFLYIGLSVASIVISNVISICVSWFYGKHKLTINKITVKSKSKFDKDVFYKLMRNGNKVGLYYLSSIALIRGVMLIGGHYLSSSSFASYGLLVQLMGVVNNFSNLFNTLFQTKMSKFRLITEEDSAAKTLSRGIVSYVLMSAFGVLFLIAFLPMILDYSQSNFSLPSLIIIITYSLYSILDIHTQIFVSFITTRNEYPFVKSHIVSSILVISLLYFAFEYFDTGSIWLAVVPLIVQSFYNFWKWPFFVCKDLKKTYIKLLKMCVV